MIPPRRPARLGPAPSQSRSALRGSTIVALVTALRAAAEAGDRARFDRLYDHVFVRVYRWAYRQSGGEARQAERLTEDALSRLLTANDSGLLPARSAPQDLRSRPKPRRDDG